MRVLCTGLKLSHKFEIISIKEVTFLETNKCRQIWLIIVVIKWIKHKVIFYQVKQKNGKYIIINCLFSIKETFLGLSVGVHKLLILCGGGWLYVS